MQVFKSLIRFASIAVLAIAATNVVAQDRGIPQKLTLPDGFSAKVVYGVPVEQQGSWVSITTDPQGRLITSSQYGGLYRITPATGDGEAKVEKLTAKIGRAQGLLCAFDSLYVVSHRGDNMPPGLFRCQDTNGDDQYDEVTMLREFDGGSEHGPHAVILSPDKQSLYICAGNMTKIPKPETSRPPRHWGEDQLIERLPDPGGHANDKMAPAGWVCKTDPEGKSFELVCAGFRNEYDIAFAPNGELFTYDADMEWDVGSPWYRPTRVCHVVSGGEFGWRNGSGKWPKYYPDSLPPVHEVGVGSPTGITFGTGAKFPAKYQNALFISDWSYGKIYALKLEPAGASWTATKEVFCSSNALPVTDVTINPVNGKMYFLIGGRRSQSALYEISYTGSESTAAVDAKVEPGELVKLRRELEESHVEGSSVSVDMLWENLGHSDRHIRFASRIGLEHQAPEKWISKIGDETRPNALLEGALAVARCGRDNGFREIAVKALDRLAWNDLSKSQRLALLRVYGLMMIRSQYQLPSAVAAVNSLSSEFPSGDADLDRELSKILIAANVESAVPQTLDLLLAADTQEEQVAYAWHLAVAKSGWTNEAREKYFNWFLGATEFLGGHSFGGYVKSVRDLAIRNMPEATKGELAELLAKKPVSIDPYADLKARDKVNDWTVDNLMPITDDDLKSRDLANGKKMFGVGSCYKCHRMAGQGGIVGPDLTAAGNRFATRDLIETLVDPSKSISDQYEATIFAMEDGRTVTGRVVNLAGGQYHVQPDMINPDRMVKINVAEIEAMKPSATSPMPQGLLDTMTRDDILDLIAWMRSVK
ncbi:c-type cytochrome [Mariniblastus fucicola]|uniref:Cytochrome c n=1 Tax=Mariniblastus fucicola TaxID=980251 RepID=A0A5B9PH22_9BACT|nr:c-type cytochrome [Mariniblastus fucicola]QEG24570.1 Cytochrome c [Mariniblastus fucicola]